MPLNTRGLSNNLTWMLFTLALPPSALWGTLTGAWRHNVLFRRAGNVQLSGENAPQPSGYTPVIHHCVCTGTETDVRKQNRWLHFHYISTLFFFCSKWWNLSVKKRNRENSGLSVTRLVWLRKSKITILKVDMVSRNPADRIMNVACLEIKSHQWFTDDTKKMASLHERWLKWGRQQSHLSHDHGAPVHRTGTIPGRKSGETEANPQDKRDDADRTPAVEEIRARAGHTTHKPTLGCLNLPSAPLPPGPPVTTNAPLPTGRSPRCSKVIWGFCRIFLESASSTFL